MPQDKKSTYKRLSELWENQEVPILNTIGNKYILFSDMHLGDGGGADDFHKNAETFLRMLDHYKKNGYDLILLGDIEELWQFQLDEIKDRYNNSVYQKIRAFGDDHIHRVFGNHDIDWHQFDDPAKNAPINNRCVVEALKMKGSQDNIRILLVHGHQGSTESDKHSWSSRFWVRAFRMVEPWFKKIGITKHPPAIKSRIVKDYERILYSWAEKNRVMLICGHSHRAIFASISYAEQLKEEIDELKKEISDNQLGGELIKKNRAKIKNQKKELSKEKRENRLIEPTVFGGKPKPCYFNTGCGCFKDGITGIEIIDDMIKLVKWHRDVPRESQFEVYEEGNLSEYIAEVVS